MKLEQSGSAHMVTVFIANSLEGKRATNVRGENPFTSKENTGVFLLFASLLL